MCEKKYVRVFQLADYKISIERKKVTDDRLIIIDYRQTIAETPLFLFPESTDTVGYKDNKEFAETKRRNRMIGDFNIRMSGTPEPRREKKPLETFCRIGSFQFVCPALQRGKMPSFLAKYFH